MSLRRALLALLLVGCTAQQLENIDPTTVKSPPCDANNPWLCPDGNGCCNSALPICWGPDTSGELYCEAQQYDPDDPTHLFGARKRVRAAPRIDR